MTEFFTGAETQPERVSPQDGGSYPQDGAERTPDVVSRETGQPPLVSGYPVRTAADIAVNAPDFDHDHATPLARAAEHVVLARQGARLRPPMGRPNATRVFVVANQKGGVGKTTSTVNIAAAAAQTGLRVLVIDLDPQGNASTALGAEHREGTPSVYDVLTGERRLVSGQTHEGGAQIFKKGQGSGHIGSMLTFSGGKLYTTQEQVKAEAFTLVQIDVGLFGSQPKARLILQRFQSNLARIRGDAPPLVETKPTTRTTNPTTSETGPSPR